MILQVGLLPVAVVEGHLLHHHGDGYMEEYPGKCGELTHEHPTPESVQTHTTIDDGEADDDLVEEHL